MRHYIIYTFCMLCTIYSAGAQNCHLDKENWDKISSANLSSTEKDNIRTAITAFIDNYNKYADVYDEEGQIFTEQDFLSLLNIKSASSDYLNDILLSPTIVQAADYIQTVYDHFPTGYGYCLHGIDIKEIRQIQSGFYAVKAEVLKRSDVYLDLNNNTVQKARELNILFNIAVSDNEDGIAEAHIIDAKLNSIGNAQTVIADSGKNTKVQPREDDRDITMEDNTRQSNQSRRNGRSGIERPDASKTTKEKTYSISTDRRPTNKYTMLYAEGGYGWPVFGDRKSSSPVLLDSTIKGEIKSGFNVGLGLEFWKSKSLTNKYFLTFGLLGRYHNISNSIETATISLSPITNTNRASKNQEATLTKFKISQDLWTVYLPVGFAYNTKSGKAAKTFMLQGVVMPGYTLADSRKISGKVNYHSYYDASNYCDVTTKISEKEEFKSKSGFTLAARLSPQYVQEYRSVDNRGQKSIGIVIGADINIGIMKLTSTDSGNFITHADNSTAMQGFLEYNQSASILHDYVMYHSVGIRIGIYFVKY